MAGMPVFFFQKEGALSLIHIYVYKRQALTNTLIIAVITAVCATILGTAAAIGIRSMNKWVKRVVMNLTNLPMVNPELSLIHICVDIINDQHCSCFFFDFL